MQFSFRFLRFSKFLGGYMKATRLVVLVSFVSMSFFCSGRGDVDISNAEHLTVEVVPTTTTPPGAVDNTPHPLFSGQPGVPVPIQKLGTIDPVGTKVKEDLDGD